MVSKERRCFQVLEAADYAQSLTCFSLSPKYPQPVEAFLAFDAANFRSGFQCWLLFYANRAVEEQASQLLKEV